MYIDIFLEGNYYSTMRRNDVHAITWMKPKTLCSVIKSQTQHDMTYMIPCI